MRSTILKELCVCVSVVDIYLFLQTTLFLNINYTRAFYTKHCYEYFSFKIVCVEIENTPTHNLNYFLIYV